MLPNTNAPANPTTLVNGPSSDIFDGSDGNSDDSTTGVDTTGVNFGNMSETTTTSYGYVGGQNNSVTVGSIGLSNGVVIMYTSSISASFEATSVYQVCTRCYY